MEVNVQSEKTLNAITVGMAILAIAVVVAGVIRVMFFDPCIPSLFAQFRSSIHSSSIASTFPGYSDIAVDILKQRGLCPQDKPPFILHTYSISSNANALTPDVIDIKYTCGIGGAVRASLWVPSTR